MTKPTDRRNSGFTLIELIVSVAILAIVVSPLLHTFLTSARTAASARRLGSATTAAQSILEAVDATHMNVFNYAAPDSALTLAGGAVSDLELFDYDEDDEPVVVHSDATTNADYYSFNVEGVNSGGSLFDARVTLDSSAFPEANEVLVTQYTPMDAVFSQPNSSVENPDWQAAAVFSNSAVSVTGDESYDADYFAGRMDRRITIFIEKDAGGEITAYTTFDYSYTLRYRVPVLDELNQPVLDESGNPLTTTEVAHLNKSYLYDFFGDSTTLGSMYFFYYPNYKTDRSTDSIYIENMDDVPTKIFIIKQNSVKLDGDGSVVEDTEKDYRFSDGYNVYIRQDEPGVAPGAVLSPKVTVFSNLRSATFEVYFGGQIYDRGIMVSELVDTRQEERMFSVTVELLEAGTDEVVYTLTGSKVD